METNETIALRKEIEEIQKKISELQEISLKKYEKLKDTYDVIFKDIQADTLTPKTFMNFCFKDEYGSRVYKQLKLFIEKYYFEKGVWYSGSDAISGQPYLSVMFDQNKPFEEQLGMLEFLPYIKYDMGVFEHTSGRYGIYRLSNVHNKPKLIRTTYGRDDVIKQFDNINEALKYIYDNHPSTKRNRN